MDQVTVTEEPKHYMTREFLETTLAQNKERIQQLEEHIQKVTQRSYADSADRNTMIGLMQEWTLGELENQDITEEQAEAIAEICGFELTKEFELEVTVQYSITVNARNEEEAKNAIYEIDFDSVSYGEEVTYLSSSVDRIEI